MTRSVSQSPGAVQRKHNMRFGTALTEKGVNFSLWAPTAQHVVLRLNDAGLDLPMTAEGGGWYSLETDKAAVGHRYQFVVDDNLAVPDPASRQQFEDVHGPSVVIDPSSFAWQDLDWNGLPWEQTVLYELHVGTFSTAGTFNGVTERLDYLNDLGITAIQMMPVADFPGKRNWGYDGVLLFAPERAYGTAADLKNLVQEAHKREIMVFLDVVYNHFGPEGNYLHCYARQFFTDKYKTPWGDALNFDAEGAEVVRDFFIQNALYWLQEFHLDGLRFDAVHAIMDKSQKHFLIDLAHCLADHLPANRNVHLVLENEHNASGMLERDGNGRPKLFTAQWNDDFHHVFHVSVTGESDGYYSDYATDTSDLLARVLSEGFAYQGQSAGCRDGAARGEKSAHLPSTAFVSFLQNHDQIGNRAFGDRLSALGSEEAWKACLTVFLLSPQIPMLFMGDEWAASTPFCFFCDLGEDLAPLITQGRRDEFAKFPQFRDAKTREQIPDPLASDTFIMSKLNWNETLEQTHTKSFEYCKQLLKLREEHIVPLLMSRQHGESRCTVSTNGVIQGSWQLGEKRLSLIANLQETAAETSSEAKSLIVATHDVASALLPPWFVSWSITHAK